MLMSKQTLCIYLHIALSVMHGLTYATTDGQHQRHHRAIRYRSSLQQHALVDVKDKILELQCYAKCEGVALRHPENLQNCHRQCVLEVMKAPRRGHCPVMQNEIFRNLAPSQKYTCLDNCAYDFDCPEVQKCCVSSCGPVCMDPIWGGEDRLLSPVPKIIKFRTSKKHKVELTIETAGNLTYFYHVETRSHIGITYAPRKMSRWTWQPVVKFSEIADTMSKRIGLAFDLRPGRWYQVRVATINAYGFRGYSEPSKPFRLPNEPKAPKQPSDAQVSLAYLKGNYYTIKVVWCPSKSNLPIEKYKVIWSLYVEPNRYTNDSSMISNEAYVKDKHYLEITNLLPESSYYIQVQAMSIHGDRRLKSDKNSFVYNTTENSTPFTPLACSRPENSLSSRNLTSITNKDTYNPIQDIRLNTKPRYEVKFRLNRKFGMIVQISGFFPHKEKVYELCPTDTNCEQRDYSAIRVKKDSLEFSKLKYDTTYVLKALDRGDEGPNAAEPYTFTTPKCENFRKRFPKMQIKC